MQTVASRDLTIDLRRMVMAQIALVEISKGAHQEWAIQEGIVAGHYWMRIVSLLLNHGFIEKIDLDLITEVTAGRTVNF